MYKSMTADKYITERIDDQCSYYDRSAGRYKTRHFAMRSIISSATNNSEQPLPVPRSADASRGSSA